MSHRFALVISLGLAATLAAAPASRKQSLVKQAVLLSDPQDMHTTDTFFELYEQRFTEQELEKLIAFLESDTGRKFRGVLDAEKKWLLGTTARSTEAERDRQKELVTRASIRAIASALIVRSIDATTFPAATTIDALAAALEPKYAGQMQRRDGWGRAFHYAASPDGSRYRIVSGGPDGKISGGNRKAGAGVEAGDDIVFEDGLFLEP